MKNTNQSGESFIQSILPRQRLETPFVNQSAIIHGGDYNPDQWLPMVPTILDEDAQIMQMTGINSASVGIFSWAAMEPVEGAFTFDWLDRVMDKQAKIGNRVILGTPSGAMPAWLAEKYPEARRVDRRGFRAHYGDRHNHCWTSPAFHERVQIINTKLAERYRNHPALSMWHVSNELNGECFCDLCRASWQKWLQKRYGTLKNMNDAHWGYFWAHQATEWRNAEPTDTVKDGQVLDWMRFKNQQLVDWFEFERDILRPITPGVPITTNFMCTNYHVNYHALGRSVDVVADDQYPFYDPDQSDYMKAVVTWSMKKDLFRCMKPDRTYMLMESCPGAVQWKKPQRVKRPGLHRMEMIQSVAHGADGTCYFQFRAGRGSVEKFHGAVVEHWGTQKHAQTRRFRELRELSDTYSKISGVLGTSVRPTVAIVYDWESRWAQHISEGTHVPAYYYDDIAAEQYLHFWQRGIPVDVIPNDRDLSSYKVVILPMHWIMTAPLAEKLRAFVQAGGTLVTTWDTGMSDESNRLHNDGFPGEGLQDVLGLWIEEIDRHLPGTRRAIAGLPGSGGDVAALVHLQGAADVARFAEDFYSGQPAVTVNRFGKGKAYFLATRLDEQARDAFYARIIEETHCTGLLGAAPLPPGVTVQIRGAGNDAFIFLLNFSGVTQEISIGSMKLTDLDTGASLGDTVQLKPLTARVFTRCIAP